MYFVTRQKTRAVYWVVLNQAVIPGQGVTSDQVVGLNGTNQKGMAPKRLRRVNYHDVETGKDYVFLTFYIGCINYLMHRAAAHQPVVSPPDHRLPKKHR